MSTSLLSDAETQLLEELQRGFPLAPRPFLQLGRSLGLWEVECYNQVRKLKDKGLLRSIGGIFDSQALGYRSTLVGLKLEPQKLDEAASHISQHPGVSHNYAREGEYNLWFTLALPQEEALERGAKRLAQEVGAQGILFLPALRTFKIRTFFSPSGTPPPNSTPPPSNRGSEKLSAVEVEVVKRLQQNLPLELEPFKALAQEVGIDQGEFLRLALGLQKKGVMRRYAGLVNHYGMGFGANGMVCWQIPPERIEEVGQALANFPQVSHCYQRPSYPQWPYNVYTMLHAATKAECLALASSLAHKVGVNHFQVLFSTKEYKQQRVRHFR